MVNNSNNFIIIIFLFWGTQTVEDRIKSVTCTNKVEPTDPLVVPGLHVDLCSVN